MSQLPERKKKNCLNCNAEVSGRFCQICGQENIPVDESTWHLVQHFFNDLTHFDGKFFSTLKYLLFKPGFVSHEYTKGRRMSYLNPIRMYIFTSALFFLIFFSLYDVDENTITDTVKVKSEKYKDIDALDSLEFDRATREFNKGKPMTRKEFKKYKDSIIVGKGLTLVDTVYETKEQYDSMLKRGDKKHNWFQRTMVYRQIELNKKYDRNKAKIVASFINTLYHSFPQILFLSLPLFALALKLLYIRRKKFFYTNHLIFSFHLYIFIFIFLLGIIGLVQVEEYFNFDFTLVYFILVFLLFYYEYRSLRNFYEQGRWKTVLKFILLNFLHFFILNILFLIFTFFSFLKI